MKNNDIILKKVKDFNLKHIFECGQAFRFNQTGGNEYTGVAKGRALTIAQNGDDVILYDTSYDDFLNIWHDYFDLSTETTCLFLSSSRRIAELISASVTVTTSSAYLFIISTVFLPGAFTEIPSAIVDDVSVTT